MFKTADASQADASANSARLTPVRSGPSAECQDWDPMAQYADTHINVIMTVIMIMHVMHDVLIVNYHAPQACHVSGKEAQMRRMHAPVSAFSLRLRVCVAAAMLGGAWLLRAQAEQQFRSRGRPLCEGSRPRIPQAVGQGLARAVLGPESCEAGQAASPS